MHLPAITFKFTPGEWRRHIVLQMLLCVTVWSYCVFTRAAVADDTNTVKRVSKGIQAHHQSLLRMPGGLSISYHITLEQDPKHPIYIFRGNLKGQVIVRWPTLRCKLEGKAARTFKGNATEAEVEDFFQDSTHNFDSLVSVSRDGDDYSQIGTSRHAFTTQNCFPFCMQFFPEMDQYYHLSKEPLKSDYHLPNAIDQHTFSVAANEVVNGQPCTVLVRPPIDKLWIAEDKGYVVCRRIRTIGGETGFYEAVTNSEFREVANMVWLPMRQEREMRDGKLRAKMILIVDEIKVGTITDQEITLTLPESVQTVDHLPSSTSYKNNGRDDSRFDKAVETERSRTRGNFNRGTTQTPARELMFYLNIVGLSILISAFSYKWYRATRRR